MKKNNLSEIRDWCLYYKCCCNKILGLKICTWSRCRGHCIPIDPFYLSWIAKKNGYHSKFIRAAGEISKYVPIQIVQKIFKTVKLKKIHLNKILLIGVSYKQNVGDDRESPAFEIMNILKKRKIIFDYYDPYFEKLKIGRKNKCHDKYWF